MVGNTGCCQFGAECLFAHGSHDLRRDPLLHAYESTLCPHAVSTRGGSCVACACGDDCPHAKNLVEAHQHPAPLLRAHLTRKTSRVPKDGEALAVRAGVLAKGELLALINLKMDCQGHVLHNVRRAQRPMHAPRRRPRRRPAPTPHVLSIVRQPASDKRCTKSGKKAGGAYVGSVLALALHAVCSREADGYARFSSVDDPEYADNRWRVPVGDKDWLVKYIVPGAERPTGALKDQLRASDLSAKGIRMSDDLAVRFGKPKQLAAPPPAPPARATMPSDHAPRDGPDPCAFPPMGERLPAASAAVEAPPRAVRDTSPRQELLDVISTRLCKLLRERIADGGEPVVKISEFVARFESLHLGVKLLHLARAYGHQKTSALCVTVYRTQTPLNGACACDADGPKVDLSYRSFDEQRVSWCIRTKRLKDDLVLAIKHPVSNRCFCSRQQPFTDEELLPAETLDGLHLLELQAASAAGHELLLTDRMSEKTGESKCVGRCLPLATPSLITT